MTASDPKPVIQRVFGTAQKRACRCFLRTAQTWTDIPLRRTNCRIMIENCMVVVGARMGTAASLLGEGTHARRNQPLTGAFLLPRSPHKQLALIMPGSSASPPLSTLVFLSALAILPINFFLPSLPQMAAEFGVDYGLIGLSLAGYAIVSA
ncbi:hypothetical protein [Devosia sp.]|uniref:hypothetical protein n=1 Tax=Devosia sp. TaxID=1871048 RepID=UPI002931E614|nr:hypothetical protein [Devosia sp.]